MSEPAGETRLDGTPVSQRRQLRELRTLVGLTLLIKGIGDPSDSQGNRCQYMRSPH
jgi:hypothetical protein